MPENPRHIAFVMEQALGHITHARNLRTQLSQEMSIVPHWVSIPFEASGLAARIPVFKSNWTVRAGWRARRALKQISRHSKLDALFFHTQVPAILATNWIRRIPSVVSLDATPLQFDELGAFYQHAPGPAWLERYKWRLTHDCLHAARHCVAWAQWTKDGLLRDYGLPSESVTVIPPGVNVLDWQCPAPRTRKEGTVKVLFVGGDLKRKGGLDLLDVFRRLRDRYDVELHLVTRDVLPQESRLFVYNNMQANSPALKKLYFECDLFCLPTYGDTFGLVLAEAGAAGLPAISTRVAGIPEVVADGETGLLVPRGDIAALSAAVEKFIISPDLRLEMGCRAQQRVAARFDAGRNALRILELVKSVGEVRQSDERFVARGELIAAQ